MEILFYKAQHLLKPQYRQRHRLGLQRQSLREHFIPMQFLINVYLQKLLHPSTFFEHVLEALKQNLGDYCE